MNRSAAHQKLIDRTAAKSTPVLLAALKTLDEKPRAEKTQEERLVSATISDVITERHDLEAKIEAAFMDTPLDVHLSYYEAIIRAMAA